MTTSAQSIIAQAHELLQDPTGNRWPATELVAHLNDGQREIATYRPDLFVVTALRPVMGAKHKLPTSCINLLGIPRNTEGASIRMVERYQLDAIEPDWYQRTPSLVIKHVMYDPKEPDAFYTYPPAAPGASVDLVYSSLPNDVPAPAGPTASSVTGNVNCPDTCRNSLLHFVLFRAWSKDAEFGGNAALAQAHYTVFISGLQGDAASGKAVQPTTAN